MPQEMTLKVKERGTSGQNAARRLRRSGRIPAVLYGGGEETIPVSVDWIDLYQVLRSDRGVNTLLNLEFEGNGSQGEVKAIIREVQLEPVRDDVLHADFIRIDLTQEIHVPVHFSFVGTPEGVKSQGGVMSVVRNVIEVACLPTDIPENLVVDVSELEIGDQIRIEDVDVPEGVKLLEEDEAVVVHVVMPTIVAAEKDEEEEEELEGEEAELAEGEEPPEGEEGPEEGGEEEEG